MAASGVTVGTVWLDVLPSMRNFGGELVSQTGDAGRRAGEATGAEMGEGTRKKFSGAIAGIAAVGAGIGLAVGAAVSQALDISAGRAKLTAQLGLTADESARYGAVAGKVFSGAYGDSLDQVNEAIRGVHQNISANLNDADLQTVTQNALNLASTFDVDLGGATAAVGQMLKTGLAPNAQAAFDIVTAGFQGGVDKAGDFLDTLNEYGGQFQKLGLDGAMATGLLSQGLQAGARDADVVADAMKEFSIRAIDGSTASAAGFKALGLDAKAMTAQIAQGGPAASAGLDQVLDRLRAMPDPVQRSQAAVALFGTQAEDLGQALYALDPSSATAALGQVAGAADAMNTTLGDTASSKLESFTRTLQTAFVDTVGGYVIPILTTLFTVLGTVLGPALGVVGAILTGAVVPALQGFGGWLRDSQAWLIPLAVGIGTFVLVLNAAAIGTALWGLATSAATAVMGIARGAVMSFQVAVWLMNAAMAANPIGIIVALIVGLVAAIVIAYQNSETFRAIIQGLWEGILTGARAVGDFFVMLGGVAATVWGGIMVGLQAVGGWFSWLWSVVEPVFSAIGLVARVVAGVILFILIAPVVLAINVLGAIFGWLYTNAVQPAFGGIQVAAGVAGAVLGVVFGGIQAGLGAVGDFFGWVYNVLIAPALAGVQMAAGFLWSGLQVIFGLLMAGLRVVGDFFGWVYAALIQPALTAVQVGAGVLWSGLQVVFGLVQAGLNGVGSFFGWVYSVLIRPALDGIGAAASGVWNGVLRPAFDGIMGGVRAVGDAFGWAVDRIRDVWNRIIEIVRPPVAFVVDVVYNSGIRPAWNFIAGIFDLGTLPEMRFATGGVLPMQPMRTGGPMAIVGEGNPAYPEYVIPTDPKYRGRARGLWAAAGGDLQMLAGGGVIGDIGDWLWDAAGAVGNFVGGIGDFLADPVGSVSRAFATIATGGLGGAGQLTAALLKMPGKAIDGAVSKVKEMIGLMDTATAAGSIGGNGGGGVARWRDMVLMALGMMGQPLSLADTVLRRMNQESGGNPSIVNTTDINWQRGTPSVGLMQVIGPTYRANADPRRNVGPYLYGSSTDPLSNTLASMRYAVGRYGSLAAAYNKAGGYDDGGFLPPGWSTVYNGTGRPEPVLTGQQWDAISAATQGGDSNEFVITEGRLEIVDDGLVRVVDARLQRVGTAITNGRRT